MSFLSSCDEIQWFFSLALFNLLFYWIYDLVFHSFCLYVYVLVSVYMAYERLLMILFLSPFAFLRGCRYDLKQGGFEIFGSPFEYFTDPPPSFTLFDLADVPFVNLRPSMSAIATVCPHLSRLTAFSFHHLYSSHFLSLFASHLAFIYSMTLHAFLNAPVKITRLLNYTTLTPSIFLSFSPLQSSYHSSLCALFLVCWPCSTFCLLWILSLPPFLLLSLYGSDLMANRNLQEPSIKGAPRAGQARGGAT